MLTSEQPRLDQEYLANNVATYGHVRVLVTLGQDIINVKRGIPHFENTDNSKHYFQRGTKPAVSVSNNVRTGLKSILL